MLAAPEPIDINFTTLSVEARVARQTLYTHWQSMGHLIGDLVSDLQSSERLELPSDSPSAHDRVIVFLAAVRTSISDPITGGALAALLREALSDPQAQAALTGLIDARIHQLEAAVGPVSREQYSQIVGPMFFTPLYLREPISDEFLGSLADQAVQILRLEDTQLPVRQLQGSD